MPPKDEYIASVSNEIRLMSILQTIIAAPAKVVIFFEMKFSKLNQK